MWVLEVVKLKEIEESQYGTYHFNMNTPSFDTPLPSKYEHIGYMKAIFRRKKDACMYYREHNPHMREILKHPTSKEYISDWDPETKLAYIIRKFCNVALTVDPFPMNL